MPNKRGPRGRRGIPRPPSPSVGAAGPLLARSARTQLLDGVEGHLAEIRVELVIQIKRMSQLREQVDEARVAIRELTAHTEPA